jgi:hypothetical protein
MIDKDDQTWIDLCQLVANEKDPQKLNKLVAELTLLLEQRERRLTKRKADEEKS